MAKKKHDDDTTTLDRAKRAVKRIDARQAVVAGAGVAAGLAIGAALFATWRKGGTGTAAGAELDPAGDADHDADGDRLHAMGTPMTMPVDGGVQRYTGDGTPDMAVDDLPESDTGSTGAADTRGR